MMNAEDLSRVAARGKGKQPMNGKRRVKGQVKKALSLSDESESEAEEVKKCKDDGDVKYYEERLAEYLAKKTSAAAASPSSAKSSFLFDGGLKVPYEIWKPLYKYQKTGVKWLWELHCQQVGGILGDEMGLGKTIQVIAFLAALHHSRLIDKAPPRYRGLGPTIIVTPVTVMHQWVKEFHSWYPPIRVAILHSTGSSSSSASALLHSLAASNGVVITSYNTFLNCQDDILRHQWQYIILDEGHKIRNPDAQVTVSVKRLKTVHRLILSGSPIQNNLKELWSLYDFVFPGKLGMLVDFMEHFAVPITQGGYANATQTQVLTAYKCACVLRESIGPYLIRRMKADVNQKQLKLPDKSEHVLFCRLTAEQRAVYKEYIGSGEVESILNGKLLIFPGLIKLRKICNHPDLTTGELRTNYTEGKVSEKDKKYGCYKRSGKMVVCKSLLKMWHKQNRKVLLFTQSTQMLDILESFVLDEGYSYLRMDGGTAVGSRHVLVNRFNQDKSLFVFLLTTRVGGLGVNLVAASRIVIYDPDWNPSTDMQARERAWRIGQQRDVIIYRLISTGSVEEKIYQRQIFKQFLTNKILSNPKQRRFFRSGDLKDLFSLAADGDDNSETQAIFAGTGSRIDLKKMQARADLARKEAKRKAQEKAAEDSERQQKMRELARKLSEKIEMEKAKQEAEPSEAKGNGDVEAAKAESADAADDPAQLTDKESKVISSALASETRNIINSDLFNNMGDLEFEARMDDKEESEVKTKKSASSKDSRCEGKTIPGLAKIRKYKAPGGGSKEEPTRTETEVDDEEYILGKLLKKSFLNGAMKHDTIVDACNADYAIVEAEADMVAKRAAEHLRQAKRRLKSQQQSDKPRFGSQSLITTTPKNKSTVKVRAASPRPSCSTDPSEQNSSKRKGSKPGDSKPKDSKPSDSRAGHSSSSSSGLPVRKPKKRSSAGQTSDQSAKPRKRYKFVDNTVFSGESLSLSSSMAVITDSDQPLHSSVLLAAMRRRNGVPDQLCDSEPAALTEDIREFLAMHRNSITSAGYVTTQDILDQFSGPSNLPAATFRAILRELCHFTKVSGQGRWTLKDEFT